MDGQFLGQIIPVAFNYAPKTWSTCAAQLLGITQNQALFALLGTTYGGDGRTTFGLPDLRGRVAVHAGQGPGLTGITLGELSGSNSVTMLANNLPVHIHSFVANNQSSTQPGPGGNALAQGGVTEGNNLFLYGPAAGLTMNASTIAPAGNSQPIPILQPYTVLQYCIALQGIFPSRN
jgi:microcystin-dependent protein